MLIAVAPVSGVSLTGASGAGGVRACQLTDTGQPAGPPVWHPDLAAAVLANPGMRAGPGAARWLWASTAECYPALLHAGGRVDRAHDVELIEALLLGHQGHWGAPRGLAAAYARLVGGPVPADPPPRSATPPGDGQGTLFDTGPPAAVPSGVDPLTALIRVYADQQARIRAVDLAAGGQPTHSGRFRLLTAAESAGALIAAEMAHEGLPWRCDVHDTLLRDLLGTPSPVGGLPHRLAELASEISEALGTRVHPESPADVLRAFARQGLTLPSTRAWVLRGVDHPAVRPLLEFKELYRIWTAHGWSWRAQWVSGGRFRAEFVPAGVVSGRWATRGGGALQIPKVIRRAVVADPGSTLVVADAGQLEPRILAACSGDPGMMRAAGSGDLYAALAAEAFDGNRATAKLALLGAMYGQTGGQAAPALATLRRSYPAALSYVAQAARAGETGELVRSWLGRTCPPPSVSWQGWAQVPSDSEGPGGSAAMPGASGAAARARGRFTRNFVIQATAAEWALALLAGVRVALHPGPARLVFFQHDEVIVHTPQERANEVAQAIQAAGQAATRLLFGDTPVRFPLDVAVVECYADAK